jgi:FtsP/CotA-like multicopper oxidase with cupredoxin domain
MASSLLSSRLRFFRALAAIQGGSLDPTLLPKYVAPLVKPPVMPSKGKFKSGGSGRGDYYEIAVRQFQQQVLPPSFPATTVWSYGPFDDPRTVAEGGAYHYPAFTIESRWQRPARVKWTNGLMDSDGNFLPHLLPVDQTLHWANPPGPRDTHGTSQEPYRGPVPIVTHVHGSHTTEDSDGFPEAWYLPAAKDIPGDIQYATGTFYDYFLSKYGLDWEPGTATFTYPNDQRATTSWYHDHTLGMTRLNVYAGPAGFYLVRGGPSDQVIDIRDGSPAVLPGPAPSREIRPFGTFYEIPIGIQDRSFNEDGSLFYPDNRAFFEGLDPAQLQIPFEPDPACNGMSDVHPIWNPEFFGNTIVVNGQTWPFLDVEQRRYRFRFLNGCQARFLILKFDHPAVQVWMIGSEGGFLPEPLNMREVANGQLLLGPAERADVIVDFTDVPAGTPVTLLNLGPDEPFGGGVPGEDFEPADPETTGQVMELRVGPAQRPDRSTPPQYMGFPRIRRIHPHVTRSLSLNEESSQTVFVREENGNVILDCASSEPFGPIEADLGILAAEGMPVPLGWDEQITENPRRGAREVWEFFNFTADAHPIHVHQVQFQVVNRQALVTDEEGMAAKPAQLVGDPRPPEPWERGEKDTVIAYPGEVTRIKAKFDRPGFFAWHCHILEHEDNEMMRPYHVGRIPPDTPKFGPPPEYLDSYEDPEEPED